VFRAIEKHVHVCVQALEKKKRKKWWEREKAQKDSLPLGPLCAETGPRRLPVIRSRRGGEMYRPILPLVSILTRKVKKKDHSPLITMSIEKKETIVDHVPP